MSAPTPSTGEQAASDRSRAPAAPAVTSDDAPAGAPCAGLEERRRDAYRLGE